MGTLSSRKLQADVVVTGEAVALQVRPASLPLRVVSALIDALVAVSGIVLSLMASLTFLDLYSMARAQAFSTAIIAFWAVLLPLAVETLTSGYSIGRYVVGNRVVRDDGGPIRFRHALARVLLSIVELWGTLGALAFVVALTNRRGKRLGDVLAGTYVISSPPATRRLPLIMPPELAQWAAGVRVAEIPTPLAISIRRYLQGASRIIPKQRWTLANQLAAEVEPLVYPPPPWGTDPERFLAAVMVVRRDFEYHRLLDREERLQVQRRQVHSNCFDLE